MTGTGHGSAEGADALLDPVRPDCIGADPDGYVVRPTLLWTGCEPLAPAATAITRAKGRGA